MFSGGKNKHVKNPVVEAIRVLKNMETDITNNSINIKTVNKPSDSVMSFF